MLIGLMEDMTSKWERQREEIGEGAFTDEMLGRPGTLGTQTIFYSKIWCDCRFKEDGLPRLLEVDNVMCTDV